MLLYFVQNVFFESKIILLCVIIAIQHTSSSKTSARKTQLAKQDRGRKQPLYKTRCRKFPVKLVLSRLLLLKDEIEIFLLKHCFFQNGQWLSKLCYLSDIFERFNDLNVSLQGRNCNIFTSNDKIESCIKKINIGKNMVEMDLKLDFPKKPLTEF